MNFDFKDMVKIKAVVIILEILANFIEHQNFGRT